MHSITFFFFAHLASGGLNYLFQVLASRQLDAKEFADLNSWFAQLALAGLIPGILQYYTNFFPSPWRRLRFELVAANLLAVLAMAFILLHLLETPVHIGLIIVFLVGLVCWLSGQAQNRMLFGALAWSNLCISLGKIALVLAPFGGAATPRKFLLALALANWPCICLLTAWLARSAKVAAKAVQHRHWLAAWSTPLIMSAATAFIPQMDTLLLARTQSSPGFQDYSRASIFSRGIFYFFFIFAQWLLPRQIHAGRESRPAAWPLLWLGALTASGIAMTVWLAPWVGVTFLKWSQAPDRWLILVTCSNMALLTWSYIALQRVCAQGRHRIAAFALAAVVVEGIAQLGLGLEITRFYVLALIANFLIAVVLERISLPAQ